MQKWSRALEAILSVINVVRSFVGSIGRSRTVTVGVYDDNRAQPNVPIVTRDGVFRTDEAGQARIPASLNGTEVSVRDHTGLTELVRPRLEVVEGQTFRIQVREGVGPRG